MNIFDIRVATEGATNNNRVKRSTHLYTLSSISNMALNTGERASELQRSERNNRERESFSFGQYKETERVPISVTSQSPSIKQRQCKHTRVRSQAHHTPVITLIDIQCIQMYLSQGRDKRLNIEVKRPTETRESEFAALQLLLLLRHSSAGTQLFIFEWLSPLKTSLRLIRRHLGELMQTAIFQTLFEAVSHQANHVLNIRTPIEAFHTYKP
ncbi:uncharacterized protein V6R79_003981 [Siganus canaliculatus]